MSLFDTSYKVAVITDKEKEVKTVVEAFVSSLAGKTDAEKRSNLSEIKVLIHPAVDYVMAGLPNGVARVDGSVIRPILNEVIREQICLLPIEKI